MPETPIRKLLFGTVGVTAILLIIWLGADLWRGYYLREGRNAFSQGDYQRAGSLFKRSLLPLARNPESHFYLGKIALGKTNPNSKGEDFYPWADYDLAVMHYQMALSEGVKDLNIELYEQTLNDMGFSLWMLKKFSEADGYFIRFIAEFPNKSFTMRYLLAYDYFSIFNKPQEALDILLPVSELATLDIHFRNLHKINILFAQLYSYHDDFENAAKYSRIIIENGSQATSETLRIAHVTLAYVHMKNGNFAAAKKEIAEANKLAGSEIYTCDLANAYSTAGYHLEAIDASRKIINQASELKAPRYSICLNALADSLYALGMKTEAEKFYREYIAATESSTAKDVFSVRRREKALRALQ